MWTASELASNARRYAKPVWRIVEDQAFAATVRITSSLANQKILEEELEASKPALPPEAAGRHFLIASPFRYRPYPNGSRFRRAGQAEGAFYASESVSTAAAELAFYRFLFFLNSPTAERPRAPIQHTAFSVRIATRKALDLTAPPLVSDAPSWIHPTDYSACQALADTARSAGIDVLRFQSVRDPAHGAAITALSLNAITDTEPRETQTWHLFVRHYTVQAWCEMPAIRLEFSVDDWQNDPRIPARPKDGLDESRL